MSKATTKAAMVTPATIPVSFDTGTFCMATLPLTGTDDAGNVLSVIDEGVVVSVTLYWPDHPVVMRTRLLFRNALARLQALPATANDDERVDAEMRVEETYSAFAAVAVQSWTVAAECTIDNIRSLMVRAPFVRDLIAAALGGGDRFLPESLRSFARASPPPSEAVA